MAGILVNGEIADEFRPAYNLQLEIIRSKRKEHLAKKKGLSK